MIAICFLCKTLPEFVVLATTSTRGVNNRTNTTLYLSVQMKTLLRIIAMTTLVIVCAGSVNPAFATLGLCTPDCDSNSWVGPSTTNLTLPSGCVVRVTYYKRFACGQYYDTQIQDIEPLNSLCSGTSVADMVHAVEDAILIANPMGFPAIPVDSCTTRWRISRASCWRLTPEDQEFQWGRYLPCADTSPLRCCLVLFQICRTGSGYTVTRTGSNSTSPNCVDYGGFSCTFVCP